MKAELASESSILNRPSILSQVQTWTSIMKVHGGAGSEQLVRLYCRLWLLLLSHPDLATPHLTFLLAATSPPSSPLQCGLCAQLPRSDYSRTLPLPDCVVQAGGQTGLRGGAAALLELRCQGDHAAAPLLGVRAGEYHQRDPPQH